MTKTEKPESSLALVNDLVRESLLAITKVEAYHSYLLGDACNDHYRNLCAGLLNAVMPRIEKAQVLFDTIYIQIQSPSFFVLAAYYNSEVGAKLSACPTLLNQLIEKLAHKKDAKAEHQLILHIKTELGRVKEMLQSTIKVYTNLPDMNKEKLFDVFDAEIEQCWEALARANEALLSFDAETNKTKKETEMKVFTTGLGDIQIHLANIDSVLTKIKEKLKIAELDAMHANVSEIHGWAIDAVKCCSLLKKALPGKTELSPENLSLLGLLKLNLQHIRTRGARFLNGTVKEVLCRKN